MTLSQLHPCVHAACVTGGFQWRAHHRTRAMFFCFLCSVIETFSAVCEHSALRLGSIQFRKFQQAYFSLFSAKETQYRIYKHMALISEGVHNQCTHYMQEVGFRDSDLG